MLDLNLQRFAGEKTERATPTRRRKLRREGRVVRSPEFASALVLIASLAALRVFGPNLWNQWLTLMQNDFQHAADVSWADADTASLCRQALWEFIRMLAPWLGVVFAVGGAAAFAQVGPGFWPKRLLPDLKRVNPAAGLKRLFSMRAVVDGVKSLLKLAVVALAAYVGLRGTIAGIPSLSNINPVALPGVVGQMVFRVAILTGGLMLVIGALDYFYQRFDFERSIRMSLQEIREEMKHEEGDPLIKSTIRKRGRALAMQRMMQEVPKADVVITNPTHFAVALRYDAATMQAPCVTAKGADALAWRIRQLARDNGVPVIEQKPLAQALYRTVDVGEVIPEELYQAVAKVLAQVYRMRDERMAVRS
ncbi:flagellar biosynthesis protein FlhB [Alicyclobacillus herbarius]|uniref:flagellar biosynthesis protein FlhB n=1 Tax=Alicyclobacillus herbarius TaxID=122960 RepID=UPI000416A23E|nr:flagellar biosynthesis protein FlhB [Alicyclobacillus herbarius]